MAGAVAGVAVGGLVGAAAGSLDSPSAHLPSLPPRRKSTWIAAELPGLLDTPPKPSPPVPASSRLSGPLNGPAKASPRPPAVAPKASAAEKLEVVHVEATGKNIPSPVFDDWRNLVKWKTGPQPPKLGRFKSKAQWRWAFSKHMPFAHRWAHGTGPPKVGYHSLPERKGPPTPGSLR